MREVFADTFYWVASLDRRDNWHDRARAMRLRLAGCRLLTTEEVLVEVLASFSRRGAGMRRAMIEGVRSILNDPSTEVVPQSHASFLAGLALYEARLDKEYSLVDCISMQTMRDRGIAEVLTCDRHFLQEGFTLLLRDD